MRLNFIQQAMHIVLQHVVTEEFLVLLKAATGRTKGSVCIVVITDFFVDGIPQKSASPQYQYSLSSLTHALPALMPASAFVEWRFHNSSPDVALSNLDIHLRTRFGIGHGDIAQSNTLAQ